jgi:hypothetical protein
MIKTLFTSGENMLICFSEILHRSLNLWNQGLCRNLEMHFYQLSQILRYEQKNDVKTLLNWSNRRKSLSNFLSQNSYRLVINMKRRGLSSHYCSNCHHYSKIKCTTALDRDAIFGLSHGSVRNWPSQKSIYPFLCAQVHCACMQWRNGGINYCFADTSSSTSRDEASFKVVGLPQGEWDYQNRGTCGQHLEREI